MKHNPNKMLVHLALLLPAIILMQVYFSVKAPHGKIINVHESIEQLSDVAKLKSAMEELGIATTVLHGIPNDLLRFKPGDEVNLAGIGSNHDYLATAAETYPEEFFYFCSIDPSDPKRAQTWEECKENGASGVKLYIGYSYSHVLPIDDPSLEPFYTLLEEDEVPLMLPVNVSLYQTQLENVLISHPDLNVICAHYCLSSKNLDRLDNLMSLNDNLWVDTSFGHVTYFIDGMLTMTANHDEFKDFFDKHQDRILFATDNVITTYEGKSVEWVINMTQDYIRMFSEDGIFPSSTNSDNLYRGLGLSFSQQRKLFWKNWEDLVN